MRSSIDQLHQFYNHTSLGQFTKDTLSNVGQTFCPNTTGCTIAGFGYAVPVLAPHFDTCERLVALMPAEQGVIAWPNQINNVAVLCDEGKWPLPDNVIDILFVLHALETSNAPTAVLDECWRTLNDTGRVLFIVPNRLGSWARYDQTPFGIGRPFSLRQMERYLSAHGFAMIKVRGSLFTPPIAGQIRMRFVSAWGRFMRSFSPLWAAGVLCVEAQKTNRPKPHSLQSNRVKNTVRVLLPEQSQPVLPKQSAH